MILSSMNWENKTLFVGDNLHKMMWPIGWVLSAPNAGAIYVDDLFPQDKNKIKRLLERIGAGDPVYYADFLRYAGEWVVRRRGRRLDKGLKWLRPM